MRTSASPAPGTGTGASMTARLPGSGAVLINARMAFLFLRRQRECRDAVVHLLPRGVAPRTPLHALSHAAAPARSVRVAHSLRSFAARHFLTPGSANAVMLSSCVGASRKPPPVDVMTTY